VALPGAARAADDYSPAWLIHTVTQVCQAWSDGITRCMPVAVVAPANPAGKPLDALMPTLAKTAPSAVSAATPNPVPADTHNTATTTPAQAPVIAGSTLPRLPLPGLDPSTNPYLVHTPYARQAAPAQATPMQATAVAAAALPETVSAPATPATTTVVAQAQATPAVAQAAPTPTATSATGDTAAPRITSADTTTLAKLDDTLTHFEFDKAELTDAGRAALDTWLGHKPAGLRVRVNGHADRFGPARYNMVLSRRRAESVTRYLAGKGMKPEDMVVQALGESQPVVSCKGGPTPETKACLAPNRRVEIKAETVKG
jgi:outer membrane protein OmpA-like peptidoglycan-associated protein